MISKINSAITIGVDSKRTEVEVDVSSKDINVSGANLTIINSHASLSLSIKRKLLLACKNSKIDIPDVNISVNISPSRLLSNDISLLELPILVGILHNMKMINFSETFLEETVFVGELSLDGSIKKSIGIFTIACGAAVNGFKRIVLSKDHANECGMLDNIEVIGINNIFELLRWGSKEITLKPSAHKYTEDIPKFDIDFCDIKGNENAKRAMQVCVAGGHNLLLYGPPGSGKSMLAKRANTIVDSLPHEKAIDVLRIHSTHKKANAIYTKQPPFRAPHHTISHNGLIGGGMKISPGEISLAHNGILFLDEMTEVSHKLIEALRQPLEDGYISLSRLHETIKLPCQFILIGAINPCPCGYLGDTKRKCSCSKLLIRRYLKKLSGPIMDRIDLQVYIPQIDFDSAQQRHENSLGSKDLKKQVIIASKIQNQRFSGQKLNAHMSPQEIEKYCTISSDSTNLLKIAFDKMGMSMRTYSKILKIARTIADLEGSENITEKHIKEVFQFRTFDRFMENYG